MKTIQTLASIENYFDTFILDLWGVIHNGKKAYKDAINCIEELYKLNKNIILISNSSRNNILTIKKLEEFGFSSELFTKVLTSGQTVWEELKYPTLEWSKKLGSSCYHLTKSLKKTEYNFTKGLNKILVDKLSSADFIIASSADPLIPALDYIPFLKEAYENKLPFICVNPDYESIEKNKNNEKIICMGTIGKLYESFGGKVHILGKPSKHIYEKATKSIINFEKSRTIAIGDSVSHDIVGAYNFGIKSILITSGIHKDVFQSKNLNFNEAIDELSEFNIKADYMCDKLVF